MAKVRVVIDGKTIEAEEGKTILQVARENGIYIPTLCYHENLNPIASCRLCIVEVEGYEKPITSCNTPVEDGMVIHTNTAKLNNLRREYLKLILSYHPLDCPICDRAGNCELQDLVFRYGVETSPYKIEKLERPTGGAVPIIEGWINYWPDRCVLCKRCVSACSEIVCNGAIEVIDTGFSAYIGFRDEELCRKCGECMVYCPVGALTDAVAKKRVRPWHLDKVLTTCPFCGVGCQMELHVFEDEVLRVGSRFDVPPNNGNLCVKGRFGYEFIKSPDRLKKPLIRKDGDLVEVSWDEALDYVSKRLKEIIDQYGPNAVGFLASAKCTNEENYVFQKFARAVLGTNNIDHCERLCTVSALSMVFGYGAMMGSFEDIGKADVILLVGANTAENHPVLGNKIKRAVKMGKSRLIVVDPRDGDLSRFASYTLKPKPGTDVAWINGMIKVILDEDLWDKEFVKEVDGFDELRKVVSQYTPEKVEEITGIPKDKLTEASRLFGKAKNAIILYGSGITQHASGTDCVLALCNLAIVTGNIGKEGTGINPLPGQNNVQGACDMGCIPNFLPGYQGFDDYTIDKFEKAWGVSIPKDVGLAATEMFHSGSIKALYVVGENPALTEPGITETRKFLENLELLVVQDIFLTETAKLAHVVLPAACFAEKDGTFTNMERRIQRVRKAVNPPGEAMEDWKIICEIAKRMGYNMDYSSPSEIMDEINKLVEIYGGVTYQRLENGGIQWPCPTEDHPGTPYLYKDGFLKKPSFYPVDYKEPPEITNKDYPFILTTGRVLYHFHTSTMTGRTKIKDLFYSENLLEMNDEDAKELGIKDGDEVKLISKNGEVKVKVSTTSRISRGVVFLPFHFMEGSCNWLMGRYLDPVSKIPELKVCPVRIEKF